MKYLSLALIAAAAMGVVNDVQAATAPKGVDGGTTVAFSGKSAFPGATCQPALASGTTITALCTIGGQQGKVSGAYAGAPSFSLLKDASGNPVLK